MAVILKQASVIFKEMAFEQVAEGTDGSSHKFICGKSVLGRGTSKDNGHEAYKSFRCSRTNP